MPLWIIWHSSDYISHWFDFLCHSIHVCITSRSDIVSNVSYTDWWYIVTVAFVIAVILLDIPTTNAHPTVANVVRLRCVCCSAFGSWCISFLFFFFYFLFLELQFMRINLKVALATSWIQRQNTMTDNTVDKMGDLEWTVFAHFWHETPHTVPWYNFSLQPNRMTLVRHGNVSAR